MRGQELELIVRGQRCARSKMGWIVDLFFLQCLLILSVC